MQLHGCPWGELIRLTAGRHRRILIASGATLLISAISLGLIGFTHTRGRQAVQNDTAIAIGQTAEELIRRLQSRRGTLTLLRDTLNRRPEMTLPALQAMGASAVQHTRHLLGTGIIRAARQPVWWLTPEDMPRSSLNELNRAIRQRTKIRGIWRVPSTSVTTTGDGRQILMMLEPLRASGLRNSAIIGVFDLKPLLKDFFSSSAPQRYPVQVLDGTTVLYRSAEWASLAEGQESLIAERPVRVDAARWMIQMQPGSTGVVKTLSWLSVLLIGLSVIAGLGMIMVIWILATRASILQRAVTRRTASLRRALMRVRQLAITDELTGLYNRRFFLRRLAWEWGRAKRYQRPLACLMIDVNNFKQVNDRLGHAVGDLVLQQVAQELKATLRQSDFLARFGGDEFVIALPETSYAQATRVAQKLRKVSIDLPEARVAKVSPVGLSVGIGHVEQPDENTEDILEAADRSLYAHKRRTKSSVTLEPSA